MQASLHRVNRESNCGLEMEVEERRKGGGGGSWEIKQRFKERQDIAWQPKQRRPSFSGGCVLLVRGWGQEGIGGMNRHFPKGPGEADGASVFNTVAR